MTGFILRRLAQTVLVLWAVATLIFLMMVVLPKGDPTKVVVGKAASPEVVKQVRKEWGFDRPRFQQYLNWLGDISTGNLRTSYTGGKRPVVQLLKERYPRSLTLAFFALLIELFVGLVVGIYSAIKRYSFWDSLATVTTTLVYALPVFWLGVLLQYAFGWATWMPDFLRLPPVGYEPITAAGGWQYYVLPAVTLAAVSAAFLSRVVRSTMLDAGSMDFVRTARAKGLSERSVTYGHTLRNALNPIITIVAVELGTLIGASIITEVLFGFEGVGATIVSALEREDTPVVMGFTLVLTAIFVLLNFLADIAYAIADPRVKSVGRAE